MKIKKWVELSNEVEVEIDARDISSALAEAFAVVTQDLLGEQSNRNDVLIALNHIARFLGALTEDQIDLLKPAQRAAVSACLAKHAERFHLPGAVS